MFRYFQAKPFHRLSRTRKFMTRKQIEQIAQFVHNKETTGENKEKRKRRGAGSFCFRQPGRFIRKHFELVSNEEFSSQRVTNLHHSSAVDLNHQLIKRTQLIIIKRTKKRRELLHNKANFLAVKPIIYFTELSAAFLNCLCCQLPLKGTNE